MAGTNTSSGAKAPTDSKKTDAKPLDQTEPTSTSSIDDIRSTLDRERGAGDVMAEALAVRREALQTAEKIVADAEQAAALFEKAARARG